jgi:PiT family inorganic phosphate transporter
MTTVVVAIALALVFDVSNGFHDSSNSVAALVATRAARPASAVVLAGVFHLLGPLLAGEAVADTVGSIVHVADGATTVQVAGAALTGALAWNLVTWWRGIPSSSSHALVGGLAGAGLAAVGPAAIDWGHLDGWRPKGVLGVVAALAVSPMLGFAAGFIGNRVARRALRRATRRIDRPIRRAEWVTAAGLAFSHGANDAQKTMGVMTLVLVASGHLDHFAVPLWVKLAAATSLTIGTSLGGWRIVRTIGRGIFRMRPLDGLVSQAGSAAVIWSGALVGAPVSTSHVVAMSVVGSGASHRFRHVRWTVVREMGVAWLVTLPMSGLAAVAALPLWRWLG